MNTDEQTSPAPPQDAPTTTQGDPLDTAQPTSAGAAPAGAAPVGSAAAERGAGAVDESKTSVSSEAGTPSDAAAATSAGTPSEAGPEASVDARSGGPGADARPGDGLVTPPPVATREPTGDVVVDAVLDEFDRVTGEPLDAHVEVGEKVHRTLQARLADLGDE